MGLPSDQTIAHLSIDQAGLMPIKANSSTDHSIDRTAGVFLAESSRGPASPSQGRRSGAPIGEHQFARRGSVAHLEQVLNFRVS
jgi:hypothetical protein